MKTYPNHVSHDISPVDTVVAHVEFNSDHVLQLRDWQNLHDVVFQVQSSYFIPLGNKQKLFLLSKNLKKKCKLQLLINLEPNG